MPTSTAAPAGPPPAVSVLFPDPTGSPGSTDALDDVALHDLQLDQLPVVGRDDDTLGALYRSRLTDLDAITYRQEVFADLDRAALHTAVRGFRDAMQRVRRYRSGDGDARRDRTRWLLQAVRAYLDALDTLTDDLEDATLGSRALRALRVELRRIVSSEQHRRLAADTDRVSALLGDVRYRLHLDGPWIGVERDDDPTDHTARVAATFARFRRPHVAPATPRPRRSAGNEHLDAMILAQVATLFPEAFAALERFGVDHADPFDATVVAFDRDVAFYLGYLDVIAPLVRAGLPVCTPTLSTTARSIDVRDTYDLVLAAMQVGRGGDIVRNDVVLHDDERILVVSGANQGGKTTFARTVGQLHHLACLGCPVPGSEARLPLCDRIVTHVSHGERLEDRHGRLQDDLVRIRAALDVTTDRTLVIVNELFRSTTAADATVLGRRILAELIDRDATTVFVTFLDELTTLGPPTVSLVAGVDPDDPAARTLRIERRPADGRAHAVAIAARHRLSYEQLRQRVGP